MDKREFDKRVVSLIPLIRHIGGARLRAHHDLDDFTQETVVRLCAHRDQLRDSNKLKAWASVIARRLADEWNGKVVSLAEPNAVIDPSPTPHARVEANEQRAALQQAVASLSDTDRLLVRGVYYDERSCDAVGQTLSLSHGATRMRLHRARQTIRRRLEHVFAAFAAFFGFKTRLALGGIAVMKTGVTVGVVVGVAAMIAVGAAFWVQRGKLEAETASRIAEAQHQMTRDAQTVGSGGGAIVRETDNSAPTTRAQVGALEQKATREDNATRSAPTAVETLDPVAQKAHEDTLTPEQRRVYEALKSLLPRQAELKMKLVRASRELPKAPPEPAAGAPQSERDAWKKTADEIRATRRAAFQPIFDAQRQLDAQLEALAPAAFKRTQTPDGENIQVDMGVIEQAAGGKLPPMPRPLEDGVIIMVEDDGNVEVFAD